MSLPKFRPDYRYSLLTLGRTFEWGVLALLVVAVVLWFMYYMRQVQAMGEYAAVRTTLGALRTALVLDHLQHQADQAAGVAVPVGKGPTKPFDPFDLLDRRVMNYRGIAKVSQAKSVMPGSWVFDPACPCVGYRPIDDGWLDAPSGDFVAWYVLGGAPGPLMLTAREPYRWQDQRLE